MKNKTTKKSTRRVLNISKNTMDILQAYCKNRAFSLTEWADRELLNAVATVKNAEYNPLITITNKNSQNTFELFNLFYSIIDQEQMMSHIVEDFILSGNSYFEVKIGLEGVHSVIYIPINEKVTRIENSDLSNKMYVKFKNEKTGQIYERFQILHFRILDKSENLPYGTPFNMERFNDINSSSQAVIRNERTIERLAKIIESEFETLGIMHLYAKGFRDKYLIDFKIKVNEEILEILIENYYLKSNKPIDKFNKLECNYEN